MTENNISSASTLSRCIARSLTLSDIVDKDGANYVKQVLYHKENIKTLPDF